MIKQFKTIIGIVIAALFILPAVANADGGGVTLKGNFQTEGLVGQLDSVIGATEYNGPYVSNSYLDLALSSQYVPIASLACERGEGGCISPEFVLKYNI